MIRPAHRLLAGSRLGYRGAILILYALFFAAYGVSLLTGEQSSTSEWRNLFAPPEVQAALWFALAAVAMVFAFTRRDAIGYSVSIAVMSLWTLLSFASWAWGEVERGWVSGVLFTLPTLILAVDSGRAEPARPNLPPAPPNPPESP